MVCICSAVFLSAQTTEWKKHMKESIALGFGNNIDYEISWDSSVFEDLIIHYGIRDDELDINTSIRSERDLVVSILSFVKLGIGGERFVATSAIIEDLSQRFDNRITLGGTSVRAALAMRKLGYTSALHLVTINDQVRSLLPPDCPYVCSNPADRSYPHLIVQYGQDTRVRAGDIDLHTNRPNRLIYHSDDANIIMNLNEGFADLVTEARVLLISGFNAMQDEALLTNRINSVLKIIQRLPKDALIYYEDAGFHEPRFSHLIYHMLAQRINILSLNEDELQDYLKRKIDLLDISQIEDALTELQDIIPVPVIVVHTRHWALAYGDKASRFAALLKAGVTMATTRFCYGDDFTAEDYRTVETLAPAVPNAAFVDAVNARSGDRMCCVPVADVDQSNGTTVGLGDAFVGGFLAALNSSQARTR